MVIAGLVFEKRSNFFPNFFPQLLCHFMFTQVYLVSLYPCQHLALSQFFILAILLGLWEYVLDFNLHFPNS